MIHLTLIFEDQNIILTRTSAGWVGIAENSEMNQARHLLLTDAQVDTIMALAMAEEYIWTVVKTAFTGYPDGSQISP